MKKLELILECKINNKIASKILKYGLKKLSGPILQVEGKNAYLKGAKLRG